MTSSSADRFVTSGSALTFFRLTPPRMAENKSPELSPCVNLCEVGNLSRRVRRICVQKRLVGPSEVAEVLLHAEEAASVALQEQLGPLEQ